MRGGMGYLPQPAAPQRHHALRYIRPIAHRDIDAGKVIKTGLKIGFGDIRAVEHAGDFQIIDRQTGAIIWRLGGVHNQFAFSLAAGVNGPAQFYKQPMLSSAAVRNPVSGAGAGP